MSYYTSRDKLAKEAHRYFSDNVRPILDNNDKPLHGAVFENNDVDAFRHAYAAGIMAMESDASTAKLLGIANEIVHPNAPEEQNMDLWNNDKGIESAKDVKSRDELADKLIEAMNKGELITDKDNDTRKSNPMYDELIKEMQNKGIMPPNDFIPEAAPLPGGTAGFVDWLNDLYEDYFALNSEERRNSLGEPLAIDLDGDGIETVSKENSTAYFDLDRNGFSEKTGWIKGDDALLARDVNGDGIINDGGELFGDQTAKSDGTTAVTGFQALADLDSNADGKISVEDTQYDTLRVWQDKNQNGISEADELRSLTDAGIKSILTVTVSYARM